MSGSLPFRRFLEATPTLPRSPAPDITYSDSFKAAFRVIRLLARQVSHLSIGAVTKDELVVAFGLFGETDVYKFIDQNVDLFPTS